MRTASPILVVVGALTMSPPPVFAGPWDQPYALVEAERASTVQDRAPATVMKIDGKDTTGARRPDPIAPGRHSVEVSVPGRKGMSSPQRQVLDLDAEACTRYHLAAKRSSLGASDWTAYVARAEPIGECRKKFGLGPAKN